MMKATKYIVIGRYDSERNSWIEGGDIRHIVSCHNSQRSAAVAAEHAHGALGGCDGSDALAHVAVRLSAAAARKAQAAAHDDPQIDLYEHADRVYRVLSAWDTHEVCVVGGWLGMQAK